MSHHAEDLTWERARAGKSDLLMLLKIADLADDEGRNAWPEVPRLMKCCRASERATQNILTRLERDGEIEIEYNDAGREIVLRGGRTFRPKWFIHVRCVCEWEAYQAEQKPAASADSPRRLRSGRPPRKPAASAGSRRPRNPQLSTEKPAAFDGETRRKRRGGYIGIDPVVDPVVEPKQERTSDKAGAPRRSSPHPDANDPSFLLLVKTAYDAIDLEGPTASLGVLADAVKSLCHIRELAIGPTNARIHQAIDAALWQRSHQSRSG